MLGVLIETLVPLVRPRYVVDAEERVYVHFEDETRLIRPDLAISDAHAQPIRSAGGVTAVLADPVLITLPMPEEVRERYLTVRNRETHELVTVIELLSPSNKRSGSHDQAMYLEKRNEVIRSEINLVELDLLRGGQRLPSVQPLPPADFYAIVCRAGELPRASAYHWTLRQSLPTIPIPLAEGDADVALDLQSAFGTVYDRAGYDYALDYAAAVEPPLLDDDRIWTEEIVHSRAAS
jgi:hypothetical protein